MNGEYYFAFSVDDFYTIKIEFTINSKGETTANEPEILP